VAPILSGRRAGLVLALAAILAPLGIGTAQAATPPPVQVTQSPSGAVFTPIPVQFACSGPGATSLTWRTSQAETGTVTMADGVVDGTAYYTAKPTYNSRGGHWIEAFCVDAGGPSSTWTYTPVSVNTIPSTTTLSVTPPAFPGDAITGTVTTTGTAGPQYGFFSVYVDGVPKTFTQAVGSTPFRITGTFPASVSVYGAFTSTGEIYQDSQSAPQTVLIPQEPVKVQPTVTVQVPATAYANSTFPATATVTGSAGGPVPTGEVEFRYSEGASLGRVPLVNGVATADLGLGFTGTVDIYATYFGDEHYTDRSSARQYVTLSPVPTPIVTVDAPKTGTSDKGVTATVIVAAPDSSLPTPGGGVQLLVVKPGTGLVADAGGVLANGVITLSTGPLPVGEYTLLAHYSGGGDHPYQQTDSAEQSLVISAPVVETPTPGTPTPGTPTPETPKPETPTPATPVPATPIPSTPVVTPAPVTPVVTTDKALAQAGARVTLRAEGFVPGETVRFVLHSDPVFLGTAVADANGVATLAVALPDGVPAGQHHVVATGVDSGRVAEVPILVADPRGTGARLATTGTDPAALTGLVAALLVAGAGLLVVARVRRRAA